MFNPQKKSATGDEKKIGGEAEQSTKQKQQAIRPWVCGIVALGVAHASQPFRNSSAMRKASSSDCEALRRGSQWVW